METLVEDTLHPSRTKNSHRCWLKIGNSLHPSKTLFLIHIFLPSFYKKLKLFLFSPSSLKSLTYQFSLQELTRCSPAPSSSTTASCPVTNSVLAVPNWLSFLSMLHSDAPSKMDSIWISTISPSSPLAAKSTTTIYSPDSPNDNSGMKIYSNLINGKFLCIYM
jgi:hypothetical protein